MQCALQASPLYSVTNLGAFSQAWGINDAGQIAGQSGQYQYADIYANGAWTNLGAGYTSQALAINNSGTVVGFTTADGYAFEGFSASGGSVSYLGTLGGSSSYSFARDVNDAGTVVGYSYLSPTNGGAGHGFIYSNGTMIDFNSQVTVASGGDISLTYGLAQTTATVAYGINNSGQITGEIGTDHGVSQAFLFTAGTLVDLGSLDPTNPLNTTIGWRVNDAGQVIGWGAAASQFNHAFLYSNGVMTDLGTLSDYYGSSSEAFGINNQGQVVGVTSIVNGDGSNGSAAFLYSNGVMTNLNDLITADPRITLVSARGINNSGQIIVNGLANGYNASFLLTPTSASPEPSTLVLLGSALLFGVARFRAGLKPAAVKKQTGRHLRSL